VRFIICHEANIWRHTPCSHVPFCCQQLSSCLTWQEQKTCLLSACSDVNSHVKKCVPVHQVTCCQRHSIPQPHPVDTGRSPRSGISTCEPRKPFQMFHKRSTLHAQQTTPTRPTLTAHTHDPLPCYPLTMRYQYTYYNIMEYLLRTPGQIISLRSAKSYLEWYI
jgi:hypothetical protein